MSIFTLERRGLFDDEPRDVEVRVGGEGDEPGSSPLPTVLTLAGYAADVFFLMGGSWWFAIGGLLLSEVATYLSNRKSVFSSELDYAIDLTMTGASALRAGIPWILPIVTPLQVLLHDEDEEGRPRWLSARSFISAYALGQEHNLF